MSAWFQPRCLALISCVPTTDRPSGRRCGTAGRSYCLFAGLRFLIVPSFRRRCRSPSDGTLPLACVGRRSRETTAPTTCRRRECWLWPVNHETHAEYGTAIYCANSTVVCTTPKVTPLRGRDVQAAGLSAATGLRVDSPYSNCTTCRITQNSVLVWLATGGKNHALKSGNALF